LGGASSSERGQSEGPFCRCLQYNGAWKKKPGGERERGRECCGSQTKARVTKGGRPGKGGPTGKIRLVQQDGKKKNFCRRRSRPAVPKRRKAGLNGGGKRESWGNGLVGTGIHIPKETYRKVAEKGGEPGGLGKEGWKKWGGDGQDRLGGTPRKSMAARKGPKLQSPWANSPKGRPLAKKKDQPVKRGTNVKKGTRTRRPAVWKTKSTNRSPWFPVTIQKWGRPGRGKTLMTAM